MSKDISSIVEGWDFEPGKISVRKIAGRDGRPRIQLRLDLGVLQMAVEGRPDGRRPHGYESLLHYHRRQLFRHRSANGTDEGYELDGEACDALRAESVMYYHRYLSEFALAEYDAVISDTDRNLQVLEFCQRYAAAESDRMALEPYRPYILMMHTRARAMRALAEDSFDQARKAVEEGLEKMLAFGDKFDQSEAIEASGEVAVLRSLLDEIASRKPVDPIGAAKASLERAVAEERYEDAARLRDQLRVLRRGATG